MLQARAQCLAGVALGDVLVVAHHANVLDSNHLAHDFGCGAKLADVPSHHVLVALLDRAAVRVAVAQHGLFLLVVQRLVVLRAEANSLIPRAARGATATTMREACAGRLAGAALVEDTGKDADQDDGCDNGGDGGEAGGAMGRSVRRPVARGWRSIVVVWRWRSIVAWRRPVVSRTRWRRGIEVVLKVVLKISAKLSLSWLFIDLLNDLEALELWLLNLNHLDNFQFFHVLLGLFGRRVFMFMLTLVAFRGEVAVVVGLRPEVALFVVVWV